jgi:predicted NUDIX family phosphoesterase
VFSVFGLHSQIHRNAHLGLGNLLLSVNGRIAINALSEMPTERKVKEQTDFTQKVRGTIRYMNMKQLK